MNALKRLFKAVYNRDLNPAEPIQMEQLLSDAFELLNERKRKLAAAGETEERRARREES